MTHQRRSSLASGGPPSVTVELLAAMPLGPQATLNMETKLSRYACAPFTFGCAIALIEHFCCEGRSLKTILQRALRTSYMWSGLDSLGKRQRCVSEAP